MKKIFYIVLALAILAPFSLSAKQKGTPTIKFAEAAYNFGSVPEKGGSVTHEFEFENVGNANLVILDATAECGCTTPEYPKNPIAPGKKGVVRVTYNPLYRPGSFTKGVTVRTNGKPKKVRLKITGNVIQAR